jgi:hypothetical protein
MRGGGDAFPTGTVASKRSHPADHVESVCDRLQSSASSSHNWEQAACQPSSVWLRGDRDVRAGNGPSIPSIL